MFMWKETFTPPIYNYIPRYEKLTFISTCKSVKSVNMLSVFKFGVGGDIGYFTMKNVNMFIVNVTWIVSMSTIRYLIFTVYAS